MIGKNLQSLAALEITKLKFIQGATKGTNLSCLLGDNVFSSFKNLQEKNVGTQGRRYIYNRKDKIIQGLSQIVKYDAPLFRDMSLAKV